MSKSFRNEDISKALALRALCRRSICNSRFSGGSILHATRRSETPTTASISASVTVIRLSAALKWFLITLSRDLVESSQTRIPDLISPNAIFNAAFFDSLTVAAFDVLLPSATLLFSCSRKTATFSLRKSHCAALILSVVNSSLEIMLFYSVKLPNTRQVKIIRLERSGNRSSSCRLLVSSRGFLHPPFTKVWAEANKLSGTRELNASLSSNCLGCNRLS
mmetsp:Transcript_11125/g.16064  ORF Transcript_11125/g.16064 Transcript_11125/m.16064 type:complete len:220 (+) Transcript_11125:1631-2290(+)